MRLAKLCLCVYRDWWIRGGWIFLPLSASGDTWGTQKQVSNGKWNICCCGAGPTTVRSVKLVHVVKLRWSNELRDFNLSWSLIWCAGLEPNPLESFYSEHSTSTVNRIGSVSYLCRISNQQYMHIYFHGAMHPFHSFGRNQSRRPYGLLYSNPSRFCF